MLKVYGWCKCFRWEVTFAATADAAATAACSSCKHFKQVVYGLLWTCCLTSMTDWRPQSIKDKLHP